MIHALLIFLSALATTAPSDVRPSEPLRVFVVTMGPGDEPWEKFGHNMIWFTKDDRVDVAFNWGMFDFDQENFIWHFVQGKLWYWGAGYRSDIFQLYIDQDRTVDVQELNVSETQKRKLLINCETSTDEKNKYYLYDYFTNNCSTKVRDAVDDAIGGQLKTALTSKQTSYTYRSEYSRLVADSYWLYVSLYYVLGHPVDRPLSEWADAFLPARLHDQLPGVTFVNEAGQRVPLVLQEQSFHHSSRQPLRSEPPRWLGWFIAAGVIIGGAEAFSATLAARRSRWKKIPFVIITLAWAVLSAFAGWFCLYAWLLTNHVAVRPNENVLHLSALLLPMIVLIPLMLAGKGRPGRIAVALAALAAMSSLLGLLAKVLPAMNQVNANVIALALPANAGLLWALWRLNRWNEQERNASPASA